jgi:hypothetical protein
MRLEDVKNIPRREMRSCRAALRLYPSQMKFIVENDLSVQAIFDRAVHELGHVAPAQKDIESIARQYAPSESRGKGRGGKGNVARQRAAARKRGKR